MLTYSSATILGVSLTVLGFSHVLPPSLPCSHPFLVLFDLRSLTSLQRRTSHLRPCLRAVRPSGSLHLRRRLLLGLLPRRSFRPQRSRAARLPFFTGVLREREYQQCSRQYRRLYDAGEQEPLLDYVCVLFPLLNRLRKLTPPPDALMAFGVSSLLSPSLVATDSSRVPPSALSAPASSKLQPISSPSLLPSFLLLPDPLHSWNLRVMAIFSTFMSLLAAFVPETHGPTLLKWRIAKEGNAPPPLKIGRASCRERVS